MSTDHFFVQLPAEQGEGDPVLHSRLVHTVNQAGHATPSDDPDLICWAVSGLNGSSAAVACALGRLQAERFSSIPADRLRAMDSPEWAHTNEAALVKGIELGELLLNLVNRRIQAILEAGSEFAQAFKSTEQPGALTLNLPDPVQELLKQASMTWSRGGTVSGFFGFLQFGLSYWQSECQRLQARCHGLRCELELWTLHRAMGRTLAEGATHLLLQLEKNDEFFAGRERTERHLREHSQEPFQRPWTWLLDEWGDSDDCL